MLPRSRLATREQIQATIKSGRGMSSLLLSLKYSRHGQEGARAAVVVSAKTEKTAVGRNRLKRRLRAILASLLPKLALGTTLVVFAKKEAVRATYVQLEADVQTLISKL